METFLMAILSLQNIHKSFNGFHALRGVNLDVEKGETVAIIGPSGCGKSTLLRCIGLLDLIDEGSIHMNGQPVITADSQKKSATHINLDQYRASVGIVFQHLNIWPHLTVIKNITLAPRLVHNHNGKDVMKKAMALLDRMDIADKAKLYPNSLSGGELQRVALARALVMDPEVLLLDEITSALDPELVGGILDIIAELTKGGMTMLIVTHEMMFASEVADKVIFMDEGKIVEDGMSSAILTEPKTDRLKRFLTRISRHRRS